MQYGITLAPFDRWDGVDDLLRVAQTADRLGYGFVSLPDHLLVPDGS